jgi:hypothetical protein
VITRVAIKVGDKVYIGQQNERHDALFDDELIQLLKEQSGISRELGFITDTGEFLNRAQADDHAFKCKQISKPSGCLVSEDLW